MTDNTEQMTQEELEQGAEAVPGDEQPGTDGEQAPNADSRVDFIIDELEDELIRIHLDKFDGPFEVLLYLIKTQEIDVFDIPIVKVTEQYLRFLELMREESLDVAGEFLVLAATLIQIKSKMILPPDIGDEDDEEFEEEDPRLELVEKLLEYRKYRDMTELFSSLEEARSNWFGRKAKPEFEPDDEDDYIEATLYDLLGAFRGVLRYFTEDIMHTIEGEGASIDDKIAEIEDMLDKHESVAWTDLFKSCTTKVEMVCFFLAILELCRMKRIRAHQHKAFGDIRVFACSDESRGDHEVETSDSGV